MLRVIWIAIATVLVGVSTVSRAEDEQAAYVAALFSSGFLSSVTMQSPIATVEVGPRYDNLPAEASRDELCQTLLSYYNAQDGSITEVIFTASGSEVLRCSQ